MVPIFPAHLLNPDSVTPRLDRRTVSGGVALSGDEDVIATDGGGRIVVEYGDMASDDPATQRLLNAWDSYLAGGAAYCRVPLVTAETAPRQRHGYGGIGSGAPARLWQTDRAPAGGPFIVDDDQFPMSVEPRFRSIQAATVGASALRATAIRIRMTKGSPLLGGEWFSASGGERAYRIERILDRPGGDFVCRINPPLRTPIGEAEPLEFEWPTVKARLAPNSSLVPTLSFGLFGDVPATFQEVL